MGQFEPVVKGHDFLVQQKPQKSGGLLPLRESFLKLTHFR